MSARPKQVTRAEQVAVADDAAAEDAANWLCVGAWVAVVMPDPIYYGRVAAITPTHYYLTEASWIVETGLIHDFALDANASKVAEYIGDVAVARPEVAVYRIGNGGRVATR